MNQTITIEIIDGIDDVLKTKISEQAEAYGLSRTETIKRLLTEVLSARTIDKRRKMFAPFCGIWTDRDADEFEEVAKDFETVNSGDWE